MFSDWERFGARHRILKTFLSFSENLSEISFYFLPHLICISNCFQKTTAPNLSAIGENHPRSYSYPLIRLLLFRSLLCLFFLSFLKHVCVCWCFFRKRRQTKSSRRCWCSQEDSAPKRNWVCSGRLRHVQLAWTSHFGFGTSTRRSPAKVQNQLTLTCEGTLKYYGFDRSSQSASVGGEGLEKYNPGKSVCKRDQTNSRSNHIQKQSTAHCFVRKLHELRPILSLRSRKHMPTFCSTKNLLYRPPLKEMGPSTGVSPTPPLRVTVMRTTSSGIHIRSDDDEKNDKGWAAGPFSLSPTPPPPLSLSLSLSLSVSLSVRGSYSRRRSTSSRGRPAHPRYVFQNKK